MKDLALVRNRAAFLLERLEDALAAGQIGGEQWYREVAAVITPAYLAGDNPRAQSGSNSDDASWQLNRSLIADAIHKERPHRDPRLVRRAMWVEA